MVLLKAGIFLPLGNDDWIGGLNYFRNLLIAVNRYSAGRFKVTVMTDRPELLEDASGDHGVVENLPVLDWRRHGVMPRLARLYYRAGFLDFVRLAKARTRGLDVLSHNNIGYQTTIPTLSWIPDFQHCALPSLFTEADLRQRDRNIAVANRMGHVLVSSESARQDFAQYYPDYSAQVHVLRFASTGGLLDDVAGVSLDELVQTYQIPRRYIYLPNQFWTHKNHEVVIEALAHCSDKVTVVCTGSTSDHRNAAHFARLQALVSSHGLNRRFRILGIVPYAHVLALMRQSVAVLNPSRFEGWSTPVEEAKLLGKPLLLSSIPVHREQAAGSARYFDPDDHGSLGTLLEDIMADPGPHNPPILAALTAAAAQRQSAFVDRYHEILMKVAR